MGNTASTHMPALPDYSANAIASGTAWKNVSDLAIARMQVNIDSRTAQTCQYASANVRTEFRNMTLANRKSYTDAVECLQQLPPQVMTTSQNAQYPGVKSRHDEYVGRHGSQ
jgi:tyrosinase